MKLSQKHNLTPKVHASELSRIGNDKKIVLG